MAYKDALRWNRRYGEPRHAGFIEPRAFLVEHASYLPEDGLALDIAMGMGGNAAFLLSRGLRVVGLDISMVAVQKAKRRLPGLQAAVMDLDSAVLPPDCADVICNFYYLNRGLCRQYWSALRPCGLLLFETLTVDMLVDMPDIEAAYLLQKGELLEMFSGWQVLVFREEWIPSQRGSRKAVAGLVARKPY